MERITVTMANAPGITPVSQIPPGYEADAEGGYDAAAGLLDSGDQRFMPFHRLGAY